VLLGVEVRLSRPIYASITLKIFNLSSKCIASPSNSACIRNSSVGSRMSELDLKRSAQLQTRQLQQYQQRYYAQQQQVNY
jgi:hypothetical protein